MPRLSASSIPFTLTRQSILMSVLSWSADIRIAVVKINLTLKKSEPGGSHIHMGLNLSWVLACRNTLTKLQSQFADPDGCFGYTTDDCRWDMYTHAQIWVPYQNIDVFSFVCTISCVLSVTSLVGGGGGGGGGAIKSLGVPVEPHFRYKIRQPANTTRVRCFSIV